MTLEPIMEAIDVDGQISGLDVIDDLCCQIAAKLARHCDLRATDAYSGYSAKVQIELQLTDLDTVGVSAQMVIGTPNPSQPFQQIAVDVPQVSAEEVFSRTGLGSPSLERPIDGVVLEAVRDALAPSGKRQYVSRIRSAAK
jgi:hypothetical protein